MATSLLIGNGINRVTNKDASWEHVLNALVPGTLSGQALEHMKHKPFALVYEEILLTRMSNDKRVDETAMKQKIAELVGGLRFNDFHRRVMDSAVRHVITTNYDYGFEKATGLSYPRRHLMRESKYSVFRRRAIGSKFVWHIHGEVEAPNTITLGYDQYSGYLQKLRSYATADRETKNGSPFKMGMSDFDTVEGTVLLVARRVPAGRHSHCRPRPGLHRDRSMVGCYIQGPQEGAGLPRRQNRLSRLVHRRGGRASAGATLAPESLVR